MLKVRYKKRYRGGVRNAKERFSICGTLKVAE